MIDFLTEYAQYLRHTKQASDNTVASYLRDLRQFADYAARKQEKSLDAVKPLDVVHYVQYLTRAGKSRATIARSLASLRSFYHHLIDMGQMEVCPVQDIRLDQQEKKQPQILTGNEVNLLLSQPKCNDTKGIRDKAMLELLYATGIRVSELITLDVTDVDDACICCRSRDKRRVIPLHPTAVQALTAYLRDARPVLIADADEPSLFVNLSGTRMTRQGFWKLVKHYQVQAGIQKEITPHTLRQSCAVHLLEHGAALQDVREMLGLRDMSTIYTQFVRHKDNACDPDV